MPGWESNPSGGLILRNLLILENAKFAKCRKKAEPRYTAGTERKPLRIANASRSRNSHLGSRLSFDKDIHRYCPNLQTRCSSDLKLPAPSYDLGQWARN